MQAACQQLDADARVVYVGCNDDGRTVVRVAAGETASVAALQRALSELLPLSRVRASEDVLSGAMQAEVVVSTRDDEWTLARSRVAGLRLRSWGAPSRYGLHRRAPFSLRAFCWVWWRGGELAMAIDVTHACSEGSSAVNALALGLSVVFSVYILADSVLTAWVIARKSRERAQLAGATGAATATF